MGLCRRCRWYMRIKFSEGHELVKCSNFEIKLTQEALECSEFQAEIPGGKELERHHIMNYVESIEPIIIDPDGTSKKLGFKKTEEKNGE